MECQRESVAAGARACPLRLYSPPPTEFEAGDLLFFYGRGWISWGIELATWGPSHVAIVCDFDDLGKEILVESTTLCDLPCLVAGQARSGVQFHHPAERVASYEGRVERMRLLPGLALDDYELQRMARALRRLAGHGYTRAGAGLSATGPLFKASAFFPYPDLGSVFCSELCAHALQRARLLPPENPATYNPASLMRDVRRRALYGPPESIR